MRGVLVAYRLPPGADRTLSSKVAKNLYGQATSSRGYRYRRKGLLDAVPHIRLIRAVLILRREDAPAVIRYLEENGCTVHMREVVLTLEDREGLSL
jgi:hypothetical protein